VRERSWFPQAPSAETAEFEKSRSVAVRLAISTGPDNAGGIEGGRAGNRDPLAARWLSGLLALQIKSSCWPAEDALGDPSTHSEHEHRQPALGRTSHPWQQRACVKAGDRQFGSGRARHCAFKFSPRLLLCVPKTSSVLIARPNRLNVSGDDRAALLFPDLVRLAVQVKEPT
jgi:hypothetical protein